ncbi:MAG: IS630 family transposase [Desulfobacterales bacterium]|nr:IS630 family transposase [Desulfobacterales bacterium]
MPGSSFLPPMAFQIRKSGNGSICRAKSSRNGVNATSKNDWPDFRKGQGAEDPALFPPEIIVAVKALACQLPKQLGLPFSKFTHDEIAQQVTKQGIVASISGKTVWRWLSKDAIRPWCYRSWIWPRDPDFEQKAGRVLDLYQGFWKGKPLGRNDFVISSDEKTSIQARHRLVPVTAPAPGRYGRVEHEYERRGALAYMAAWDVQQAKVFGLCRTSTGIQSFHDLVDLVMSMEPYRSAHRVFWITDNGSSHRGQSSIKRLKNWYSNAIQVHTPIHASWLNQVEIYFSVLQRKVLSPNDFESIEDLENSILSFQTMYEQIAKPFKWKFTRKDLKNVLAKCTEEQKLAA